MLAKGVINGVVQWETSREYFYWRLQRGLAERKLKADLLKANPDTNEAEAGKLLQSWFGRFQGLQDVDGSAIWTDDRAFLGWIESDEAELARRISSQRKVFLVNQIVASGTEELSALGEAIGQLMKTDMAGALKEVIREALQ